jgi:hypothetical protein
MKIYLAARYDRRWQLLGVASTLERAGHEVTSRWIEGGRSDDPAAVPAVEALLDLARSDCLVAFTEEPPIFPVASSGERHVEFGIALATGKRLCIVGPRETVFHHLLSAERYATVADLIEGLKDPNPVGPPAPTTTHRSASSSGSSSGSSAA